MKNPLQFNDEELYPACMSIFSIIPWLIYYLFKNVLLYEIPDIINYKLLLYFYFIQENYYYIKILMQKGKKLNFLTTL